MSRVSKQIIESFIFGNFPEAEYVSGNDKELHFNSPFTNDGKKRLYVSVENGRWFDQKEQRGGNKFENFVAEYLGTSAKEAIEILKKDYSNGDVFDYLEENTENVIIKKETINIDIPEDVVLFGEADELDCFGKQALEYIEGRKINPNGLGYFSTIKGGFWKRIFVPFYENGKLIYFVARSFDENEPMRYKNPPEMNASSAVFNYDKIKDDVFIFEGVFDALSLDFPQVGTAMLSSVIKEEQAKKIMGKNPKNIILVPDKDKKIKTKVIILENLIKTYDKLMKFKKYKQNVSFFIYMIPDEYKDFNDYKKATGKGNISFDECKEFKKDDIITEINILNIQKGFGW
jgi:hypothetical protein